MLLQPMCLIFLSSYLTNTYQQTHDASYMKVYNESQDACIKEIGVDRQVVNTVWNRTDIPNDRKMMCYFKCLNLRTGIMNEKGDIVEDVLKRALSTWETPKEYREIMDECKGINKGSDLCETAYKLSECVLKAIKN